MDAREWSFGIGTHFTNDFERSHHALNIVIKLYRINGVHVAELATTRERKWTSGGGRRDPYHRRKARPVSARVHLAAAAVNTTPKDWDGNVALILESIRDAKSLGVRLLCLPELAITGYGCEDEFQAAYVSDWAAEALTENILPATSGIAVTIEAVAATRSSLQRDCICRRWRDSRLCAQAELGWRRDPLRTQVL